MLSFRKIIGVGTLLQSFLPLLVFFEAAPARNRAHKKFRCAIFRSYFRFSQFTKQKFPRNFCSVRSPLKYRTAPIRVKNHFRGHGYGLALSRKLLFTGGVINFLTPPTIVKTNLCDGRESEPRIVGKRDENPPTHHKVVRFRPGSFWPS